MSGPVLLYDGTCALCSRCVRFVLGHDRRGVLRFASLDSDFAQSVLAGRPALQGQDTVVWYEPAAPGRPERVLTRSAAVLSILRYLGGRWRLGLLAAAIPRPFLDMLYRLVSRSRRRVFGAAQACDLPQRADRHRFLA